MDFRNFEKDERLKRQNIRILDKGQSDKKSCWLLKFLQDFINDKRIVHLRKSEKF